MSRDDMGDDSTRPSRREVLRVTGGAIATGVVAGTAAGDPQSDRLEVNVGYANARGARAARELAVNTVREFGFDAATIEVTPERAEELRADRNIRYVEENGEMHALQQTVPYGISKVQADTAIDDGKTGAGVDIAIVDSGIDARHETLEANLGTGYATSGAACDTSCDGGSRCQPAGISTCYESWDDDNSHGTHVAGTAGAADNGVGVLGVAPGATLHAVKVLDCCGAGSYSDIAAGIEWAADQGHDVINMSLGGSESSTVNDAVNYAADKGVVLVAAAGNSGPCTDCVGHPAAHPEVIAVSATDQNDALADFSSTGPEVELAAPGDNVLSSVPRDDYAEYPGTSMASPHVAGAAAQLIADGTTDRAAVRSTLKNAADDVGLGDNEQGSGRLDVLDALDGGGGGGGEDCVDASNWPSGTGDAGNENVDRVSLDGQVVESSPSNAYEDFTCPDPLYVKPGDSVQVSMEWSDGGYDGHYANVHVDWDQNGDWSTATETVLMENANDDSSPATATVNVPSDAPTGGTLLRVRLSWDGFDGPAATGEYGEVNDFTVYVEDGDGGGGGDPSVAVSTSGATGVGESSATLNGELTDLTNASEADVYFEYGQSGSGLPNQTSAQTVSSTGSFSTSLSGLSSGTSYEFRAVAEAGTASDTGTVESFQTDSGGCFITTATAREPATLDSLRRFRDESMSATPLGRALVGLYYRISPPIAETLERHPESHTSEVTRSIVRTCASLSNAQDETGSRIHSALLGVVLTHLYVVGILTAAAGHAGIRLRELLRRSE